MTRSSTCPSSAELEQLLDEELGRPDSERIAAHVAACPTCQETLDRLTTDTPPRASAFALDLSLPEGPFLPQLKHDTPPTGSELTLQHPVAFADEAQSWPTVPGYEILDVLGRGGVGVVYKARHVSLDRLVALKMIRPGDAGDREELARFQVEAEAMARLKRPHIVQIYEVGVSEGRHFLALEFVEGGPLSARLAGRPLPPAQAAALVEVLARAVQVAHHAGIVHRDLKPANVLLAACGSAESSAKPQAANLVPKIADFGLAKRLHVDKGLTRTGAVMGTPNYMAPEQAQGASERIGPACDIYALGGILYQLLTGAPPFVGPETMDILLQVVHEEPMPPRRVVPSLPRDLETICLKCLEKEPGKRYPSAEALADDLARFLRREPIRARPIGPVERFTRWCRRSPRVAGLTAALFLALAGGLACVTVLWLRAEEQHAKAQQHRLRAEENERLADSLRQRAAQNLAEARQAVREHFLQLSEVKLDEHADPRELRRQQLRAALKYFQSFLEQNQDTEGLRADVAEAGLRVAHITKETGPQNEALRAFESARVRYVQLVQDHPGNLDYRSNLSETYDNLGLLLLATGRHTAALENLQQAHALLERLVREDPSRLSYRAALVQVSIHLATVHTDLHHGAEARRLYQEARDRCDQLLRDEPAAEAQRRSLAAICVNLGHLQQSAGQAREALQSYQQARDLFEALVREHPGDANLRESLAQAWSSLGNEQHTLGEAKQALASQLRARELLEELVRTNPAVTSFRQRLAGILGNLGALYGSTQQSGPALQVTRQACDIFEGMVRGNPETAAYQQSFASACANLGMIYQGTGNFAEAQRWYERSREVRARLVAAHADNAAYRNELTSSWVKLGGVYRLQRHDDAARSAFEQARETLEQLSREQPLVVGHRVRLAQTWQSLGELDMDQQAYAAALAAYVYARDLRGELLRSTPDNLNWRCELAAAYHNLGGPLEGLQRLEEARAAYETAVEEARRVVERAPRDSGCRNQLHLHYVGLARTQRLLHRPADAAAATLARQRLYPGQAVPEGMTGKELSLCIPLVGAGKNQLSPAEEAERRRYGDLAVQALRRAVAAGLPEAQSLKDSHDFDPLRDRADFQQLLRELEKPQP